MSLAKKPTEQEAVPLLALRTLLLLVAALLTGAVIGGLTWASTDNIPAGLLAGFSGSAVALERLDKWVGS